LRREVGVGEIYIMLAAGTFDDGVKKVLDEKAIELASIHSNPA
jgi:hypothetical protein